MSQVANENDDNCSVAACDFVQFDQQGDFAEQEEQEQQRPQFGQNPLDRTMNTGSTTTHNHGNGNDLKELKFMMANLEAKNQTLQAKVEKVELMAQEKLANSELKAEIRALKEKEKQQANIQALKTKIMSELKDEFAKILSTQNEQHQKEITQLKAQISTFEQKLEEAEKNAQLNKQELEAIIHANQQKMRKIVKEMDEKDKQHAIGSDQMKSDYVCQMLVKGKIIGKTKANGWNGSKTNVKITDHGLKISSDSKGQWIFAKEGYTMSGERCRKENFLFPGTIVYYFEVTITSPHLDARLWVGFWDGKPPIGDYSIAPNCYGIEQSHECSGSRYVKLRRYLSGNHHITIDWPVGGILRNWDSEDWIFGCGLLLNSNNKWDIFFTLNGILMGKQISIKPAEACLYPTVYTVSPFCVEANFGDKPLANPFKFDMDKCPGLVFE